MVQIHPIHTISVPMLEGTTVNFVQTIAAVVDLNGQFVCLENKRLCTLIV